MLKHAWLASLCLVAAAGCGGGEPPPPPQKPAPTVFDPLVEQKQKLPAAVEAAQAEHDAALRRAADAAAADGAPPGEARR